MNGIYLFTLSGIPVSVSVWYFILIGYFAYGSGAARGLLWGLCITVSVLVHEFGHAFMARRYRLSPQVMLHGWGGLCAHDRAERDRHDVFILAAGPGAGLIFGAVIFAAREILNAVDPLIIAGSEPLSLTFYYMLYINLFWSLVNLIPLWPLDGGQLFRIGMLKVFDSPARAERVTHIVGIAIGIGAVVYATSVYESTFLTILAAFITYENVTRVGASSASGAIRSKSKLARSLLDDAEDALAAGDFSEAARLCYQVRSDTNAAGAQMDKLWAILSVALEAQGKTEDAADYAKRAPPKLLDAMRARIPS